MWRHQARVRQVLDRRAQLFLSLFEAASTANTLILLTKTFYSWRELFDRESIACRRRRHLEKMWQSKKNYYIRENYYEPVRYDYKISFFLTRMLSFRKKIGKYFEFFLFQFLFSKMKKLFSRNKIATRTRQHFIFPFFAKQTNKQTNPKMLFWNNFFLISPF